MTRVKSSEYSPDAMASKHSRAETLEPEQQIQNEDCKIK